MGGELNEFQLFCLLLQKISNKKNMKEPIELKNLYSHETDVYNMKGFEPKIVDAQYLKDLGVTIEPSEDTLQGLIRGSKVFMKRIENHTVIPVSRLYLDRCIPEEIETEIHNYTGRCQPLPLR